MHSILAATRIDIVIINAKLGKEANFKERHDSWKSLHRFAHNNEKSHCVKKKIIVVVGGGFRSIFKPLTPVCEVWQIEQYLTPHI